MARPDILKQVRVRIENASPGDIFIPADFSDLAEARKITMCLSRLHENGTIEKVKRGVYMKPRYSMLLNRSVPPRADAVAKAPTPISLPHGAAPWNGYGSPALK